MTSSGSVAAASVAAASMDDDPRYLITEGPPDVRTGYAQVARYQQSPIDANDALDAGGPRQRRREPSRESYGTNQALIDESETTAYGVDSFGLAEASVDNAMGQVTEFCNEAVDIIGAGLSYDGGLISDEQLHGIFWQVVEKHGIPLSPQLKDSVEDDGGHAQQIATILDALCRDQLQTKAASTKQPLRPLERWSSDLS